jgi:hypothetical protein
MGADPGALGSFLCVSRRVCKNPPAIEAGNVGEEAKIVKEVLVTAKRA